MNASIKDLLWSCPLCGHRSNVKNKRSEEGLRRFWVQVNLLGKSGGGSSFLQRQQRDSIVTSVRSAGIFLHFDVYIQKS